VKQEIILKYLKEHKEEFVDKFGIVKIGLFGSFARDEENENSDIDILIELNNQTQNIYEKKKQLKEILEKEFDTKVDIAREKYLKPFVKDEILKDVKYV
jgi:predicted nucleotidyltransferase